jgi:hypothetical protein
MQSSVTPTAAPITELEILADLVDAGDRRAGDIAPTAPVRSLVDIAAINEFGSRPIVLRLTPKARAFLHAAFRNAGLDAPGHVDRRPASPSSRSRRRRSWLRFEKYARPDAVRDGRGAGAVERVEPEAAWRG